MALVTLREICEKDLGQLMEWRMSPDITRYMKTDPVLTMEGQMEWFKKITSDDNVKHWMIEVDGDRAGIICLEDIDWKDGTTSWGYYIGKKSARSFQTALSLEMSLYDYVFMDLGFREARNEVFSLNAGVIRLHEACGCDIECEIKEAVEKHGEKYDITRLTISRDKWLSVRGKKNYAIIDFDIDKRLHHIGYAVADMDKVLDKFKMGGYSAKSEVFEDSGRHVKIAFIESRADGTVIELVSPMDGASPVSNILRENKNVSLPYHLCYEVENISRMVKQMKRQSYFLTKDIAPAVALNGRNVAFLVSREMGLVELLERKVGDYGPFFMQGNRPEQSS